MMVIEGDDDTKDGRVLSKKYGT